MNLDLDYFEIAANVTTLIMTTLSQYICSVHCLNLALWLRLRLMGI